MNLNSAVAAFETTESEPTVVENKVNSRMSYKMSAAAVGPGGDAASLASHHSTQSGIKFII